MPEEMKMEKPKRKMNGSEAPPAGAA